MESLYFYNWLCFVTIELYYHLLDFNMYGMHSVQAKCRILQCQRKSIKSTNFGYFWICFVRSGSPQLVSDTLPCRQFWYNIIYQVFTMVYLWYVLDFKAFIRAMLAKVKRNCVSDSVYPPKCNGLFPGPCYTLPPNLMRISFCFPVILLTNKQTQTEKWQ